MSSQLPNPAGAQLVQMMKEILERAPESRHSFFQLKYFVLGKEPSVQGKLWQCLRELESRRDTLEAIELEVAESKDRLELLDIQMEKEQLAVNLKVGDPMFHILKKESAVKCRQLARQRESLEKSMWQLERKKKFTEQEARFFVQAFVSLERIEPLKDFDDLDSQKEYWNEKFTQAVNFKLLLQQPLDTDLVQTVLSLPEDCSIKKQMTNTLEHVQKQMVQMKDVYLKKLSKKEPDGQ